MSIEIKILQLLKNSMDFGKQNMQIQNIDLLLLRSGETEFLGSFLIKKLDELIKEELVLKEKSKYSITQKGLDYLKQNSK